MTAGAAERLVAAGVDLGRTAAVSRHPIRFEGDSAGHVALDADVGAQWPSSACPTPPRSWHWLTADTLPDLLLAPVVRWPTSSTGGGS